MNNITWKIIQKLPTWFRIRFNLGVVHISHKRSPECDRDGSPSKPYKGLAEALKYQESRGNRGHIYVVPHDHVENLEQDK